MDELIYHLVRYCIFLAIFLKVKSDKQGYCKRVVYVFAHNSFVHRISTPKGSPLLEDLSSSDVLNFLKIQKSFLVQARFRL